MATSPGTHTDLPARIGAPARRALDAAGYTHLEQLAGITEAELAKLHGMGPKALGRPARRSPPRACRSPAPDPAPAGRGRHPAAG
jgi:DNA-binding protein H-NS